MLLLEVLYDLAVVLLVGELDILEQEARHRELQLVRLLDLPLDLLAELGQSRRTFCGSLIDIPLPASAHRALLQPARYLRRDAAQADTPSPCQHRMVLGGVSGVAVEAPHHILPRRELGRERIRV